MEKHWKIGQTWKDITKEERPHTSSQSNGLLFIAPWQCRLQRQQHHLLGHKLHMLAFSADHLPAMSHFSLTSQNNALTLNLGR